MFYQTCMTLSKVQGCFGPLKCGHIFHYLAIFYWHNRDIFIGIHVIGSFAREWKCSTFRFMSYEFIESDLCELCFLHHCAIDIFCWQNFAETYRFDTVLFHCATFKCFGMQECRFVCISFFAIGEESEMLLLTPCHSGSWHASTLSCQCIIQMARPAHLAKSRAEKHSVFGQVANGVCSCLH